MDDKQITIVVAVIRNEQGDVLLAKRNEPALVEAHNKWEFIGGGIDFGESPTEALKREAKEEAGIEVEVVRLLPKVFSEIQNQADGTKLQVIILSYECKIVGGQLKANLTEQVGELKFVPIDEVKKYDAFRNIYETVNLLDN
jgi:mutator protein MutT